MKPDDRRTVLILSLFSPPTFGGAAARLRGQVKAIRRAGFHPVVYTSFPQYPSGIAPSSYSGKSVVLEKTADADVWRLRLPRIPFVGMLSRSLIFAYFSIAIFFLVISTSKRYNNIAGIFATHPVIFIFFPGFLLSRILKVKFVLGVPDLWPEELEPIKSPSTKSLITLGRPVARYVYHNSDHLIAISETASAYLRKVYGVPRERVSVMYGPVDTELFVPMARQAAREMLRANSIAHIEDSDYAVLYLGVLSQGTNLQMIVETARILEQQDAGIDFYLVGAGELLPLLAIEARRPSLRNLRILPLQLWNLSPVLICASDICLVSLADIPIYRIALNTKFTEYLACGRPILFVGPHGEAASLLEREHCGLYCSPETPMTAARLLRDCSSHRADMDGMGTRARELAESEFSVERASRTFAVVLSSRG